MTENHCKNIQFVQSIIICENQFLVVQMSENSYFKMSFPATIWTTTNESHPTAVFRKTFRTSLSSMPKHAAYNSLVQNFFPTDKHATLLWTPRAPQVQSGRAHDPVRAGNVCPHSHPHPLWSINFLMVWLVHPKPHCSSGRGWVAETEMWWGCEGECLVTDSSSKINQCIQVNKMSIYWT